jgi:hypothetical protein
VILEAMNGPDRPSDDLHHRSYFFLDIRRIEAGQFILTINGYIPCPINPLAMHKAYTEGNMESIVATIPIDISKTLGIVENVFVKVDFSPKDIQIYIDLFKQFSDVFSWSYEEMTSIDPRIFEHKITTYPDVKPI